MRGVVAMLLLLGLAAFAATATASALPPPSDCCSGSTGVAWMGPNGSDRSGDGTRTSPFATAAACFNSNTNNNDVVRCCCALPGTYAAADALRVAANVSSGSNAALAPSWARRLSGPDEGEGAAVFVAAGRFSIRLVGAPPPPPPSPPPPPPPSPVVYASPGGGDDAVVVALAVSGSVALRGGLELAVSAATTEDEEGRGGSGAAPVAAAASLSVSGSGCSVGEAAAATATATKTVPLAVVVAGANNTSSSSSSSSANNVVRSCSLAVGGGAVLNGAAVACPASSAVAGSKTVVSMDGAVVRGGSVSSVPGSTVTLSSVQMDGTTLGGGAGAAASGSLSVENCTLTGVWVRDVAVDELSLVDTVFRNSQTLRVRATQLVVNNSAVAGSVLHGPWRVDSKVRIDGASNVTCNFASSERQIAVPLTDLRLTVDALEQGKIFVRNTTLTGSAECPELTCLPGTTSIGGINSCQMCPATTAVGYVVAADKEGCSACPPGTEPNLAGTDCVTCAINTHSLSGGSCLPCDLGSVAPAGSATCNDCGFPNSIAFNGECSKCDFGTVPNPATNNTQCRPCRLGESGGGNCGFWSSLGALIAIGLVGVALGAGLLYGGLALWRRYKSGRLTRSTRRGYTPIATTNSRAEEFDTDL